VDARPVARPTARVLVIGPGDSLLLLGYRAASGRAGTVHWIAPGGGIQPGEAAADAAARELREEVGIAVRPAALGPVVAYSTGQWSADGKIFDAHDSYFHVYVSDTRVDSSGQEDLERSLIVGHRWWTPDELAGHQERITPVGLAGLMCSLLADGPPASPVRLPWHEETGPS